MGIDVRLPVPGERITACRFPRCLVKQSNGTSMRTQHTQRDASRTRVADEGAALLTLEPGQLYRELRQAFFLSPRYSCCAVWGDDHRDSVTVPAGFYSGCCARCVPLSKCAGPSSTSSRDRPIPKQCENALTTSWVSTLVAQRKTVKLLMKRPRKHPQRYDKCQSKIAT
jgi:hypothetical protein